MNKEGQRPLRQGRALRTRLQILETAAAVFSRHGYDGVSLNELIRRSGVTKGAFYFHFRSREELALATFRYKQEQLIAQLSESDDEQAPALERLGLILRRRARLLEDDPALFAVVRLGIELSLHEGAATEFAEFAELPLARLEQLIRQGQAQGDIRPDLDAREAAQTIFAGVLGIDQAAFFLAPELDIAARTEALLALLADGLRRERPAHRRSRREARAGTA